MADFRVVADTNVFVNRFRPAVAKKQEADGRRPPLSHEFVDRWLNRDFILLMCLEAWYEIVEVLERQGVPLKDLENLGLLLKELTEEVDVTCVKRWCDTDPDDDKWLRMALDGQATHLVTSDRHLFVRGYHFPFSRLKLPKFLVELRAHLKQQRAAAAE